MKRKQALNDLKELAANEIATREIQIENLRRFNSTKETQKCWISERIAWHKSEIERLKSLYL